jgi:hypothetical protein
MKKLLATLTFLTGIVLQLSGQESTLSWETHIEQENASEYVLVLKASLKEVGICTRNTCLKEPLGH